MKAKLIAAIMGLAAFASSASVTISDVIVRQQWPWNGKVNIDYVLSDPDDGVHDITVEMRNAGQVVTNEYGSLSGDLIGVKQGARRIVWDPFCNGATYSDKVMASFSVTLSTSDDAATYMVVDLSAGASATEYPVTFTNTPPEGGWNQTIYKTDKLVLRRIPAGTGILGAPTDETGYDARYQLQRKVTFTNDYYIAIFETTQKQFQNVMGYSASLWAPQDDKPVGYVNYQFLRGTNSFFKASDRADGTWPNHEATSFFGVLNSKLPAAALFTAGLGDYEMELPTISQWEYACRAGTTGAWNNGTTITNSLSDANADLLAWYQKTTTGSIYQLPEVVGQLAANAYGLYDMHGNIGEWTRDRISLPAWDGSDQIEPLNYGSDASAFVCGGYRQQPTGSTGAQYVRSSSAIRLSCNYDVYPNKASGNDRGPKYGFRIALTRKR